ncbi:MAG: antA/AntB antirepressor family protein [Parasphingorhabdus sp.]
MVDARTLHEALSTRDPFHQWIKRRREEYGFEEGEDFYTKMFKTKGRPRKDCLITIDMAKELSMLERSATGREIRRYYIDMEAANWITDVAIPYSMQNPNSAASM